MQIDVELPEYIGTHGDGPPTLFKDEDNKHVLAMYPGGDYQSFLNVELFIKWLKENILEVLL